MTSFSEWKATDRIAKGLKWFVFNKWKVVFLARGQEETSQFHFQKVVLLRERSHTTSRAKGGGGGQRKCDYRLKGDRKMRDVRGGGGPKSLKIAWRSIWTAPYECSHKKFLWLFRRGHFTPFLSVFDALLFVKLNREIKWPRYKWHGSPPSFGIEGKIFTLVFCVSLQPS